MGEIVHGVKFGINKDELYEDGLIAIKILKSICCSQSQQQCHSGRCPLAEWCRMDRENFPYDWDY